MLQISKERINEIKIATYGESYPNEKQRRRYRKSGKQNKGDRKYKNEMKNKLNKISKSMIKNRHTIDVWFWHKFKNLILESDCKKKVWGPYIYDICNHKYKYVIEVYSNKKTEDQINRDIRKNEYAKKHNYETIIINAFDDESISKAFDKIRLTREQIKQKRLIDILS